MKILVLSFYFSPDLSAGSFRTTALVEKLKEKGAKQIDVLTTMPNRYHSFSAAALEHESIDSVSVKRVVLPSHKNGLVDQIRCFKAYTDAVLKQVKGENYDVVYATSSRLMTAWLGARVSKKVGAPLYLDIRDIFADTVKDVFSGWKGRVLFPLLSMIERWTIRRASAVNIVSEGFRPYFEGRYEKLPLRAFTNGIDDEFLQLEFAESKKEKNRNCQILYAGNFGEGQGLHNIIAPLATALSGKASFKIVGGGGREQLLKDSVAGLDNVTLHPPVKRHELIDMYREADVLFLHLNDYDAFLKVLPSKLFEYGATGKPVLAGVSGYAAQFAQREISNCGVFAPCDVQEAVAAFESLALEQVDRSEFIEKFARKNIMERMATDVLSFSRGVE